MISIIIPVYNTEKYLSECLKSVLSQTYNSFELILVNDGSNDNSEFICKDFQNRDSRIKYIFQENAGANRARENGVKNACGEWIMFVDADDTIEQNALQILIDNSLDVDIVIAELDVRWKSEFYGKMLAKQYTSLLLKRKINPGPVAKLFKRFLFEDNIFDIPKRIILGEDLIMNVRLAENANKVKSIEHSIYHYRQVEESISHRKYWTLFDVKDIYKCLKDSVSEENKEKLKWSLRLSLFYNLKWAIANRIRIRTRIRKFLGKE
ncbi:MAG: glycosyltransferase [Fibromonadales bacterium]|nr:glycosyltransferase [Fibromonadales bacterium]